MLKEDGTENLILKSLVAFYFKKERKMMVRSEPHLRASVEKGFCPALFSEMLLLSYEVEGCDFYYSQGRRDLPPSATQQGFLSATFSPGDGEPPLSPVRPQNAIPAPQPSYLRAAPSSAHPFPLSHGETK